jgi:hypothetical protein
MRHIQGGCGCGCCGEEGQRKSILTDMHKSPVEGDFKDEHDKPNKPTIFESNNMLMGCSKSVNTWRIAI